MKRYLLIKNIGRLLTMNDSAPGELGIIENAAVLTKQGKVEWFGKQEDAPEVAEYLVQEVDACGNVVMPGLIDCHTHLVHGGSRELEVAERVAGKSYEEIAKAGGGILSSVEATRKASFEELYHSAARRADEALEKGITTIEVKSGYGLDLDSEVKMLKVVSVLNKEHPVSFIPTFLGAHTIPKEYKDNREGYIKFLTEELIPKVGKEWLAFFCDVFVENIAFSVEEAKRILEVGQQCGLKSKLHVDQFSAVGGAELAAELGAVSADHLEHVSDKGIEMMAEAGVVPVILPGSTFFMGQDCFAPARKFIDKSLPVAISTDYNPGTTPSLDLFLMATIAVNRTDITMEEALKGITINAAKALAIDDGRGEIRTDGIADLIILNCKSEYFPLYRYGSNWVTHVIKDGKIMHCGNE